LQSKICRLKRNSKDIKNKLNWSRFWNGQSWVRHKRNMQSHGPQSGSRSNHMRNKEHAPLAFTDHRLYLAYASIINLWGSRTFEFWRILTPTPMRGLDKIPQHLSMIGSYLYLLHCYIKTIKINGTAYHISTFSCYCNIFIQSFVLILL